MIILPTINPNALEIETWGMGGREEFPWKLESYDSQMDGL